MTIHIMHEPESDNWLVFSLRSDDAIESTLIATCGWEDDARRIQDALTRMEATSIWTSTHIPEPSRPEPGMPPSFT